MRRKPLLILLPIAALLVVLLLFPPWIATNGTATIRLGRAWFASPPPAVRAEDLGAVDGSASDAEDARLRARVAEGFSAPEIDWFPQALWGTVLLVVAGSATLALRPSTRRARRE